MNYRKTFSIERASWLAIRKYLKKDKENHMTISYRWTRFRWFMQDMGTHGDPDVGLTILDESKPFAPGNAAWVLKTTPGKNVF